MMTEHNGTDARDEERGRLQALLHAPPPLVDAVGSLVDQAITRMLTTPHAVASAAEGRRLLAEQEGNEAMADNVQRVVVLAVPLVRTLARGARFTRVPWVLLASSAFSIGTTVKAGTREVQVIGALLAHRLEAATGRPADPLLVQRLAVELYLSPRRKPRTDDAPVPLRRLLQRWLLKGVFGRDTKRAAVKALDAAERLDVARYVRAARVTPPPPAS
jgi:hypothetical protein